MTVFLCILALIALLGDYDAKDVSSLGIVAIVALRTILVLGLSTLAYLSSVGGAL